ncbi:MAG: ABC transporter substrate-binding protein [Candidatus Limnocylindrales bacterium]|nr:ABC transporter substrate-binding protein [Candidatus Limnocylindrales bacterium]
MQRHGLARLATGIATLSLLLAACSPGGGGSAAPSSAPSEGASAAPSSGGGDKGTVKIAINPWVGAEANVAVIKYLLESKLGYKVEATSLAEEIAWPGFETGEIDVILENWGHPDLEKTYIEEKKVAQDAGPNGITGIIGWYVPEWMVTEHPDITDWNTLNGYADLFKTSESGDKGQFLASDPTFVTNDEALISNLKLNFKAIYSGSEAASITAFKTATEQKKPLIGYFYDPQWVHAQIKLVQVKLPPYTDGCDADPKAVACDYPLYTLNKIVATKFTETGGDAYTLVKNFEWTNADQNLVADYITNQGMTADQAGEKWAADHEAVWKAWVPAS